MPTETTLPVAASAFDRTNASALPRRKALCRIASGVLASALSLIASNSRAEYPDRPIRAIVPFPPGGGTDVFARVIAQRLGQVLRQPIVVENRGGADGNIGMEIAARAAADGYTLLFNSSAATVNAAMYRNLRFNPQQDLRPVAVLAEYYNLIVVNSEKVAARTLPEFVALLRANPGKFNFAANGARLGIELFRQSADVDVTVVPYRGASDAIVALLRGDAHFMIVNAPGLLQHIASGKLRALAITAPKRQPDLPDVPTTAEGGLPQFDYSSFFGAYVPSATPQAVVRPLSDALNRVVAMPEVIAEFRANGATAVTSSIEAAVRRYDGDIARYREIAERAHIPPLD